MIKPWPFGDLQMFKYRLILADFPWRYEMRTDKGYQRSPEAHYNTMSDEEILSLPIGDLAHGDGAILVMWGIWPKEPLLNACTKRFGFNHISGGCWIKTTLDGEKVRMGGGYSLRGCCEPFVVARIGNAQAKVTDIPNVIIAPRREHSRKPDEMRKICERLSPLGPRVDLFARTPWPGNDVWGNETNKFETAA